MSDEIERLRIYAVKSRDVMTNVEDELRRVARKLREDGYSWSADILGVQADTLSTARREGPEGEVERPGVVLCAECHHDKGCHRKADDACPTFGSEPGYHPTKKWEDPRQPGCVHEIGLHRSEQDGMGTFGITPGHGERPAQEGAATPLKHPATGGPEGNVAKPQCDPIGHRITHPPAHPDGPLEGVTRLEVIDDTGRAYARWNVKVETSYQDQGRTLKLFVGECVHQVNSQTKADERAADPEKVSRESNACLATNPGAQEGRPLDPPGDDASYWPGYRAGFKAGYAYEDNNKDAQRYRWLVQNCHLHEAPENFGRYTYSKPWLDGRIDECMARHAAGEVGVSSDALRAEQAAKTTFHAIDSQTLTCKDCGGDFTPEFPDERPKACKRCNEAQSGEPL